MKRMPSSNDLMRCQLPARTEPNRSEAIRTGSNRPGPNKNDPIRSAVKVETIEITCSKETLGQSNHYKLKTSEIMKVYNSLSPVLFIHHF